jgi:hypothetical protein
MAKMFFKLEVLSMIEYYPWLFGFRPDTMTRGPLLPHGWDGDAWTRPGGYVGQTYLVRAWNPTKKRLLIGRGLLYKDARRQLLERIDLVS